MSASASANYDNSTQNTGFVMGRDENSTITYPGALWTVAMGINDEGKVVGYYGANGVIGNQTSVRGFLFSSGKFTPIDYPGALSTQPFGINDKGQVVGQYFDTNSTVQRHGFLLSCGVYSTVDHPSSAATAAMGINDAGQIVGVYYPMDQGQGPDVAGFISSSSGAS